MPIIGELAELFEYEKKNIAACYILALYKPIYKNKPSLFITEIMSDVVSKFGLLWLYKKIKKMMCNIITRVIKKSFFFPIQDRFSNGPLGAIQLLHVFLTISKYLIYYAYTYNLLLG